MVAAVAASLAVVSADAEARTGGRGPWLLTSVPSVGSITWRCSPYALGFHAYASSATDRVSFRAGGRTILSSTVQPGQTVRFPYVRSARQQVRITQATEPRTLQATVTVDFGSAASPYCRPYLPPPVSLRLSYARR